MSTDVLAGRLILIAAADEVVISFDVESTLGERGAELLFAATLPEALRLAEREGLAAAIVDAALAAEDDGALCRRLADRGVLFMICGIRGAQTFPRWPDAPALSDEATPGAVVEALSGLLR